MSKVFKAYFFKHNFFKVYQKHFFFTSLKEKFRLLNIVLKRNFEF